MSIDHQKLLLTALEVEVVESALELYLQTRPVPTRSVRIGAGAQLLERDDVEGALVRGLQYDGWSHSCLERLGPPHCAQAPLVAGLEP